MCPPPEPAGQDGGINILGKIDTVRGDLVGRDSVLAKGDYIADKSHEHLVDALRAELNEKSKQIAALAEQNRTLNQELDGIKAVFAMVKFFIGEGIEINNYIIMSCTFLMNNNLCTEFWKFVPEDARSAVRK